jgi:hypothetical protein
MLRNHFFEDPFDHPSHSNTTLKECVEEVEEKDEVG